tara:strand:+ start:2762 stop:2938 length:177 start_codon:yes stop_codon:yes gene_type:complete
MPKITLNQISYVAILINMMIFYIGFLTSEPGMQFLALFNMFALTIGILFRTPERKDDE